jgi:hypothetical protein
MGLIRETAGDWWTNRRQGGGGLFARSRANPNSLDFAPIPMKEDEPGWRDRFACDVNKFRSIKQYYDSASRYPHENGVPLLVVGKYFLAETRCLPLLSDLRFMTRPK